MPHQKLAFQLIRMTCGHATSGDSLERAGHEQIWLSGIGISANGRIQKAESIAIDGHRDDDGVRVFRPLKTLFDLDVPEAGRFPKACVVELLLAEWDGGAPALTTATGAGCPVRQRALGWLNRFMSDRTLLVQHASLEITSADFEWRDGTKLSPETTLEFRGRRGLYSLTFVWHIRSSLAA